MADITVKNLNFTYPGAKKPALKNINLDIKQGEFVIVCGKSGCGKTTLLRHLKPSLSPYGEKTGDIFFGDKKIEDISQKDDLKTSGFVMQDVQSQIVTDKVWHELAFGLESLSMSQKKIRTRCAEMAVYFGIDSWFYKDVSELSGGQKQILNLASVMVMSPDILILDEPTSQLDPVASSDFIDRIKKLNEQFGITVIISEHNLEGIMSFADRIIVMEDSKIIIDDSPKNTVNRLFNQKNDMYISMPSASKIGKALGEDILNVKECRMAVGKKFEKIDIYCEEKEEKKSVFSDFFAKKSIPKDGIYLEEIYFRYKKEEKDVLKNFTIHIPENTIYSINGANGSGKTTAILVLSGILKPYSGKIYKDGKKVKPEDMKTAMLPQDPKLLFVKDTVEKDLLDMFENIGEDEEKKIKKVLEFMEIKDILDKNPYDLSGGQVQRAAIAKLLLSDCEILLLDEPTKGMDRFFKMKFGEILKKLKKLGKTIIIVSHDIEFCAGFCDISAMFFDGGITSFDSSKEFFKGNSFYTTDANRIGRDYFENSATDEDVIGEIENAFKKR